MGEAPAFLVDDMRKAFPDRSDLKPKNSHIVTIVGDKTYAFGTNDDKTLSIEVQIYDKSTGNWVSPTVLGTKPQSCKGHSAVLLSDRILIIKRNSSSDDCVFFLEVDTKYVREQKKILGTEVVAWSKGVFGDTDKPIVISGPSGVGKGTLISKLMKEFPSMFGFSVSHTTRAPRVKETDGVHYHFTERSVMEKEIKNGKFLEFASVHGNLYGTSVEAVEVVADAGKRCILDIDVQGARSVRASSLQATFIFICPPSIQELEKRLGARGTESKEQIEKRVQNAWAELEQGKSPGLFDHLLVNDDLEKCYDNLKKLLGLDGSAAITHKSNPERVYLPTDYSVSQIGHKILLSPGTQDPEKVSRNLVILDVSSINGGAPGRTRGLKVFGVDNFQMA